MVWTSETILTAIGKASRRECITEARLVEITGLKERAVHDSCFKLTRHGLLEKTGRGCHRLTDAGKAALDAGKTALRSGPAKGQQESGQRIVSNALRKRIWSAMRIRRKFTVPEIIGLIVQGDERGDVTSNVQKYIKALYRAGYLVLMPRREPCVSPTSPGFKRWWLPDDKDTGPQAPVLRANMTLVYDPNTEETHDISARKDEEVAQ